jgi:hypothetical protein
VRSPRSAVPALLLAALAAACDGDPVAEDLRGIEKSYHGLRDAILQGDDEAFFMLHSRAAREAALLEFPRIRSRFAASPPQEREAFQATYRITGEEFLSGEPRALVVRMMPWKSGWRERVDLYRTARVKDVRIEYVDLPGGGREKRGVVILDFEGARDAEGRPIADRFLPTVVFEKDPEGWRRRSFFME